MAVPVVATTLTTNSESYVSSHAVDLPSHSEGDLLLMVFNLSTARTPTVSDWTQLFSLGNGAQVLSGYAKKAGASEGATKTVTLNASSGLIASVSVITGAEDIAVTPIVAGSASGASGASQVAPEITATENDSLIVLGAADSGGSAYSGTLSGYTNMANFGDATGGDDLTIFYRNTASAAGTVSAATVSAATGYAWVAFQMAIAPAAGGASAIPAFVHHRKLLGVQ